jgi:hypothetical protein
VSASQGQDARPTAPDPVVDRAVWERLRAVARRGHLRPEGFQAIDELHRLYPEWREEWDW